MRERCGLDFNWPGQVRTIQWVPPRLWPHLLWRWGSRFYLDCVWMAEACGPHGSRHEANGCREANGCWATREENPRFVEVFASCHQLQFSRVTTSTEIPLVSNRRMFATGIQRRPTSVGQENDSTGRGDWIVSPGGARPLSIRVDQWRTLRFGGSPLIPIGTSLCLKLSKLNQLALKSVEGRSEILPVIPLAEFKRFAVTTLGEPAELTPQAKDGADKSIGDPHQIVANDGKKQDHSRGPECCLVQAAACRLGDGLTRVRQGLGDDQRQQAVQAACEAVEGEPA